jgi:hypothetical protein
MPMDVSAGGSFPSTFIDVNDDEMTSCGSTRAPDLTYSFTLTETRDVTVSAIGEGPDNIAIGVYTTCGEAESELRCARGAPSSAHLYSLAAGTYFIVAEGSAAREANFTLDVSFSAPTLPPPGDQCGNAIPLLPGVEATGSLAGFQDDEAISCGFFFRDAIYSFEITEASDAFIDFNAGGFGYMSVRSDCEDMATETRCSTGNPTRTRLRNLAPGTYYVIVEATSGTGYSLNLTTQSPPSVPTAVTGNDVCGSAHVVPPTGGLYSGSTVPALNDLSTRLCGSNATSRDVMFELTLTERKRVFATLDGSSYDTVLHLHRTSCVDRGEIACNDDMGGGSSTSALDRELDPGTYYYVVDGFGSASAGDYIFEVIVSDPDTE